MTLADRMKRDNAAATTADLDEIYVVVVEERHYDVNVHVFTKREDALAAAPDIARAFAQGYDLEEELTDRMRADGWLYNATWGTEGDAIRVVTRPLHRSYSTLDRHFNPQPSS